MHDHQTPTRPREPGGLDPGWAQALGALRYGLYFLTTGALAAPQGLLVSWVSQVSGRSPLIVVSLRENRSLLPDLKRQRAFALNILPAGDQELLAKLARPASRRFQALDLTAGPLGLPLLAVEEGSSLGALCCGVREVWQPGDHLLFLGQVEGVLWRGGGPSLEANVTGHAYLGLS